MKIVAFAASNSSRSINRQLAAHVANLADAAEVELLDLNDYEMPLYSEDREQRDEPPAAARAFVDRINAADALVIAYAEHNGAFTAAYKNVVDWASRIQRKVFAGRPTLMLAASPGPGGAASVLAMAQQSAPFLGAELIRAVSVPDFELNFDRAAGRLREGDIARRVSAAVRDLEAAVAMQYVELADSA
jgi:NAD(P)H-dependent FMN reductase